MPILTEEVFKSLYIPFIKQHENPKLYEDKSDAPLCYTETINEKICIGYGYELNARNLAKAVKELKTAGFHLLENDGAFYKKLYDFYEDKSINYIELKQWIIENASVINLTKSTCDKLFEDIFPQYIKRLNDRINELIPSAVNNELYNLIKPEGYSHERGALLSLVYNNSALIGDGLANAIKNNNRAEAWYEIRYNTHGGKTANLPGIAERRIKESNTLRLYKTDNPTEAEARSAYIMYQKHRLKIDAYETKWSRYFSNETNDPDSIKQQLSAAYDYLISHYASGNTTIAWDQIYVGDEGSNHIVQNGTEACLVIADNGNDDITTGSGNDIIIGGTGNDVLNGGAGVDTYEFNLGDGYDVIKETNLENNIIKINGSISSFNVFRFTGNEVILYSEDYRNTISIQGSTNFQVVFNDAITTLSSMLSGHEQVPSNTLDLGPNPASDGYFASLGEEKNIFLPENFHGILDLRIFPEDVNIYGWEDESILRLPSDVTVEIDENTGDFILQNEDEETVGLIYEAPGNTSNCCTYINGTGFVCQIKNNGESGAFRIPKQSELKERCQRILSQEKETAENKRSPLAIDLDGDGVETVSVANGVYFDHDGNGFAEKSGWISADDALLVRDVNEDGEINDGSELFGDQTVLSNGEKAANGFEALADLDSNKDGVFDGDDDAFGEVMVWQDKNQNGAVEDGELKTLNEAGITSINLDYQNQSVTDANGNEHKQTGTAVNFDKTTSAVSDVWFKADYMDAQDKYDERDNEMLKSCLTCCIFLNFIINSFRRIFYQKDCFVY